MEIEIGGEKSETAEKERVECERIKHRKAAGGGSAAPACGKA